MDVRLLYNQLLEEMHADEAALEEKRELARLLKKRLGNEGVRIGAPVGTSLVPPALAPETATLKTLVQLVEESMPMMTGREFVVREVADAVRRMGNALPDKPNTGISTVLKRLEASGLIVRTFTGAGNVPNRYRLAHEVAGAKPAQQPIEESLA